MRLTRLVLMGLVSATVVAVVGAAVIAQPVASAAFCDKFQTS